MVRISLQHQVESVLDGIVNLNEQRKKCTTRDSRSGGYEAKGVLEAKRQYNIMREALLKQIDKIPDTEFDYKSRFKSLIPPEYVISYYKKSNN